MSENESEGNLSKFSKSVTEKVLNSAFFEDSKKVLSKFGIKDSSDVVKKVISSATQKIVNPFKNKIALIISLITIVILLIPIIITLIAGGKFIIPIIILVSLILLIWIIAGIISSRIVKNITELIFKQVEGNISQLSENKE